MVSKKVEIKNPAGIYLNFAGILCSTAMDYKANIRLKKTGVVINAKSILNVLGGKIQYGDIIEISCDGVDEVAALDVMSELLGSEAIEEKNE
ncbi:MAG: HPr family phosphocarrier protein [Eubacteriales bacterium]|nr:HPr family phosphocarrier protein [Eubacteriales bacterium]